MAPGTQQMLSIDSAILICKPGLSQVKSSFARGNRRRRVVPRLRSKSEEKWTKSGRIGQLSSSSAARGSRMTCQAFEGGPESTDTEKPPAKKKRRLKDKPWWNLTKYTAQERGLLAGIFFLVLLFGPRILVLLLAFFERAIVASGLIIEAALINIFIATFKWVAIGAGLLIVGGLIYFLQLERDRLDSQ